MRTMRDSTTIGSFGFLAILALIALAATGTAHAAYCGDGIVEGDEECDTDSDAVACCNCRLSDLGCLDTDYRTHDTCTPTGCEHELVADRMECLSDDPPPASEMLQTPCTDQPIVADPSVCSASSPTPSCTIDVADYPGIGPAPHELASTFEGWPDKETLGEWSPLDAPPYGTLQRMLGNVKRKCVWECDTAFTGFGSCGGVNNPDYETHYTNLASAANMGDQAAKLGQCVNYWGVGAHRISPWGDLDRNYCGSASHTAVGSSDDYLPYQGCLQHLVGWCRTVPLGYKYFSFAYGIDAEAYTGRFLDRVQHPNIAQQVLPTTPDTDRTMTMEENLILWNEDARNPEADPDWTPEGIEGHPCDCVYYWAWHEPGEYKTPDLRRVAVMDEELGCGIYEFYGAEPGEPIAIKPAYDDPTLIYEPPSTCFGGATAFVEDFEGENAGTVTFYDDFAAWNVTAGNVDLIADGDFALACAEPGGFCLDTVGSSPGQLTHRAPLSLPAGDYLLRVVVSGNQRWPSSVDSLEITLGALYAETFALPFDAPYTAFERTITVPDCDRAPLVVTASGPADGVGMMLDELSLTPLAGAVPGEAKALTVGRSVAAPGQLDIAFTPACDAVDHTVYYGPLGDVATLGYTGAACDLGNDGTASIDPGLDSAFFLVVGRGDLREGSYGGTRSEAVGVGACDLPQGDPAYAVCE